jgi:hypothetical protein
MQTLCVKIKHTNTLILHVPVTMQSTDEQECLSCGEEIICGSGGYCSPCWQDTFGVQDEDKVESTFIPFKRVSHLATMSALETIGIKGSDVYTSTTSPLIDLSTLLVRGATAQTLTPLLKNCLATDLEEDAFVLAFQTRDVRGGKGERKLFDILLADLYRHRPEKTLALVDLIPEYGSWRDMFRILESSLTGENARCKAIVDRILAVVTTQLKKDSATPAAESISLCAKWAPREKTNPLLTKTLAAAMFKDVATLSTRLKLYRKAVASLNRRLDTTEIKMCARTFATIDPHHVPGRCLSNNMKAFLNEPKVGRGLRHPDDPDRMEARKHFQEYFAAAKEGKVTVKAANVVYPHEIIKKIAIPGSRIAMRMGAAQESSREAMAPSEAEAAGLCAQWDAIVKAAREAGGLGRSLAMCDFSGSMMSAGSTKDTPFWVSMAMGLLISELTTEEFKDTFLTFDSNPTLHTVNGQTIFERVASIGDVGQGLSTDFQKAMDLVLATLKAKRCRPGQEPRDLIVITDMAWDQACASNQTSAYTGHSYRNVVKTGAWQTHIQMIREAFRRAGEDMWGEGNGFQPPRIVIWNVAATSKDFHAKSDEEGVIMLSGWSPSLFKVLTSEGARLQTPMEALRMQLDDPRYNPIRERLREPPS